MKYKVGDRVRLKNGLVCTISSYYAELGCQFPDAFICKGEYGGKDIAPVRLKDISHLVISDITDEMINRFKKEKIAWHFKSEQDYEKTLDILYNKELKFSFTKWRFADNCINYDEHSLYRENLEFYKSDGYEIIEIMNPVYVPSITRFIFDNFIAPPQYKGIDCEVMFQQYMQQKKIPDLEKKVENQRNEIQRLTKENDVLKRDKEKMLKDLDKMMFQLGRIAGIVDED